MPEFRIQRCLGRGGFGEVYKAVMSRGGGVEMDVAIKVLRSDLDPSSQGIQRLRDEGRLLGRMTHPSILRVYDLVVIEGHAALVSEYVPGDDLSRILKEQPVPARAVFEIVAQVAAALDAAWSHPSLSDGKPLHLVHRDVKPDNIRIDPFGAVKLLDFGIAQAARVRREAHTSVNTIMGSTQYLSPERLVQQETGPEADVFALGCTAFEVLAGEPLFARKSMRQMYLLMIDEERFGRFVADRCASFAERLGDRGVALVVDTTAHDKSRRPTAAAVALRCDTIADGLTGPTLRSWCRTRTWSPPPEMSGPLEGQSFVVQPGSGVAGDAPPTATARHKLPTMAELALEADRELDHTQANRLEIGAAAPADEPTVTDFTQSVRRRPPVTLAASTNGDPASTVTALSTLEHTAPLPLDPADAPPPPPSLEPTELGLPPPSLEPTELDPVLPPLEPTELDPQHAGRADARGSASAPPPPVPMSGPSPWAPEEWLALVQGRPAESPDDLPTEAPGRPPLSPAGGDPSIETDPAMPRAVASLPTGVGAADELDLITEPQGTARLPLLERQRSPELCPPPKAARPAEPPSAVPADESAAEITVRQPKLASTGRPPGSRTEGGHTPFARLVHPTATDRARDAMNEALLAEALAESTVRRLAPSDEDAPRPSQGGGSPGDASPASDEVLPLPSLAPPLGAGEDTASAPELSLDVSVTGSPSALAARPEVVPVAPSGPVTAPMRHPATPVPQPLSDARAPGRPATRPRYSPLVASAGGFVGLLVGVAILLGVLLVLLMRD